MKTKKTTNDRKQNFNWIIIILVAGALLCMSHASLGAADTWTRRADMPTTRLALASSMVNGKIYAIGGRADGALTSEYNPATDTWTTKTRMPTARFGLVTSAVEGKIYAIGGVLDLGTIFRTVEVYDPQTDTWTKKADLPRAMAFGSASEVDGKIYVIGDSAAMPWAAFYPTVYAYDPQTDTWTQKADMPTVRSMFSACVVNGKIYVIGGALVTKTMLSTVEVYDPATDTWTPKTPMPTARFGHTTAVVGGKIYAIGGGTHTPSRGFSMVEVYDPATDTWTTETDMPAKRAFFSSSVVEGKIYAFGGSITGGNLHPPGVRTVYEYEPFSLVVDFNGDGIVDSIDIGMLVDYWHTDEPLYDIAPIPFGDGIVDVQDLVVLSEYLLTYPGAVAYWNLDETEGDIAYDSIGFFDGVLNGVPTWQPTGGAVDGAFAFDSIDDYVSTPFVLNPADGKFSVFAWIQGGAPGQVVLSQTGGANWLLADPQTGALMTELKATGRSARPLQSQTNITDGNWHRIGLVWDGSNRTLYVDGVAVAQDTQSNLEGSYNGLYIGTGNFMEAETYFSGLIDDVLIYNRVVIP
ncbi:MAG: Kelch repeat-containing protein [Planctomycetota bacterium]|jgi:N-acetylneuraminic acid mutarotase